MLYNNTEYPKRFNNICNDILDGRNIREGYARSWGLRYGNLREQINEDTDFKECFMLMKNIGIVDISRIQNIFLLVKFFLPDLIDNRASSIIEFGSYKGGSAIFIASLVRRLDLPIKVFGLDTFEGMPAVGIEDLHSKGGFIDTDISEVNKYKDELGLDNLSFVKGLFEDTTIDVLKNTDPVCIAHIDCDIKSSVSYSYNIVKKYMMHGGYFIFDDATEASCLGATAVVESEVIRRDGRNSEQIYPHFVFRNY